MIVAVGTDLVAVARIAALRGGRDDSRFLDRVYTPDERAYCLGKARPDESLAARFAAKEATMKCLGTGFGEAGIAFPQIEVVRAPSGAVGLELTEAAAALATRLGIDHWHLSLAHDGGLAIAHVVAESR